MWLDKVCDVAVVLLVIYVVVVGGSAVMDHIRKIIPLLLVAVLLTSCAAPDVYQVSNVTYVFDAQDTAYIDTISFDLDHRASVVSVSVADDKFFLCESGEPFTHWTCDLDRVLVSGSTSMRVIGIP